MHCSECGCSLPNERSKQSHERVCDGDSARATVETLLDGVDGASESGVYVIKILHQGNEYYYVGSSVCIRQRLLEHAHKQMAVPIPANGEIKKTRNYEPVGLVDLEVVDGGKYVREKRERERAFELAIETGRTDIIGGK